MKKGDRDRLKDREMSVVTMIDLNELGRLVAEKLRQELRGLEIDERKSLGVSFEMKGGVSETGRVQEEGPAVDLEW